MTKICIEGFTYEVIPCSLEVRNESGAELMGEIDYSRQNIKININCQAVEKLPITLLHEIVHGIVFERHIDLPEDHKEQIIDSMAYRIMNILRDNPGFAGAICELGVRGFYGNDTSVK